MCLQMGAKVTYPGLRNHKQHELLSRLRNADYGCGGMLTVDFGSQQVPVLTLLYSACLLALALHRVHLCHCQVRRMQISTWVEIFSNVAGRPLMHIIYQGHAYAHPSEWCRK